jgi:UDP-N-acetyl-D-mannosaminuronic acid dehydrogenase
MNSVTILGLGYIGLPTSALIASKGINVNGVDLNPNVVNILNSGKIHIVEPDLYFLVKKVVESGTFKAHTSVVKSDVYVIVVPTPFKGNFEPDISYVEQATMSIIPFLKSGDLFIIESTSPVGTTEKIHEIICGDRPDLIDKINIAYCPERVIPGNIIYELENNDRVVGGINQKSTEAAVEFYSKFVKGKIHKTNSRTAEMCKLTENASRDNQIAFANELSMICEKAQIDVFELISLANKHPRVNILQPGPGVGGHCIAVDPYFIVHDFPKESELIKTSRLLNRKKEKWCLDIIVKNIEQFILDHKKIPIIGIYGLAFKPNIEDLRESPAQNIALKLKDMFPEYPILFIEPNINQHPKLEITSLNKANELVDLTFILVAHEEFKSLNKSKITRSFVPIDY